MPQATLHHGIGATRQMNYCVAPVDSAIDELWVTQVANNPRDW
jgi:hypothetical protein